MSLSSSQIREQFIKFFEDRGHKFVPSAPVVPADDPTLLFTNAGMNQFKPLFLGTEKRNYTRAVNSQKCIRVSGKHNDLEEVGNDNYHHTFFEMLGNWSFGDYYKGEAIQWAWELFTGVWGLPKDRLFATVYSDDDEAERLWKKVTDIQPDHVLRFGEKDNFWEMGDTGPCGPSSEIHIDLTANGDGLNLVNAGTQDVIELWNLVFIQYNRQPDRSLKELPAKHVDTGAGFERIARVLQERNSNYDIDLFQEIIKSIEVLSNKNYSDTQSQAPFRVIADHARMLAFSITDGAIPGNEGRGYVLRRILRRASLYGRKLEMHEPFIYKVISSIVSAMGSAFPELRTRQEFVERVVKTEEENFNSTLDRGLEVFETMASKILKKGEKTLPGSEVFKLYDTFGFPLDMTRLLAVERQLGVDERGFAQTMAEQKRRSRDEGKKIFVDNELTWNILGKHRASAFVGYESLEAEGRLIKFHSDSKHLKLVFDTTPFYAEAGGQVGDKGQININNRIIDVWDTQRVGDDIVHFADDTGEVDLGPDMTAILQVSPVYRQSIVKNHSATHLLHASLRKVLGDHVHQAGSVVDSTRLRFDFTHFEKISDEQLDSIEGLVREHIFKNLALQHHRNIAISEAKKMGALSFFGDKYGEVVNVVQFGEFSKEFCGGTHAKTTGEIGLFKIVSESGIAAGVRRVEAITGDAASDFLKTEHWINQRLKDLLNCQTDDVVDRLEQLLARKKDLEKEVADAQRGLATLKVEDLVSHAIQVDGVKVVSSRLDIPSNVELKEIGDLLRSKLVSGVGLLASVVNGSVSMVCVVTDDLIHSRKLHAGNLVKEVAKMAGGTGGGRPHLATAGAKNPEAVDDALNYLKILIKK